MSDYSNQYFKYKDFYFKTGNTGFNDYSSQCMNLEIIDYSGKNPWDTDRINNNLYARFNKETFDQFEKINSSAFYEHLANNIMILIVKINFATEKEFGIELNFNATEERRALFRKIKIPLIIKEIIL